MSKEQRTFEELLAYHCAPTLKGVKMANMFHVSRDLFPHAKQLVFEYNEKFKAKGLMFRILQADKPRITFYLYSSKQIQKLFNESSVCSFLKTYEYPLDSISACLDHLESRMEDSCYPHEIGIFLGYPLNDVLGFINHESCLDFGAWKVYDSSHLEDSKNLFTLFDRIRTQFIQAVENGMRIEQLV